MSTVLRTLVCSTAVCLAACAPHGTGDCPVASPGPSGPWSHTYGGPRADKAGAIAATPGGDLIVGGSTRSFGADAEDDWLLKLARGGAVLWEVRVEGEGTESVDAVAATRDGGAVMASSRSIASGPFSRRSALLVARFDCGGELLWAKTLAVGDVAFTHALRDTPDGGFLLAGDVVASPDLGGDCLVLKLSGDGNLEWQRAYGRADADEGCRGIALAPGGGYVVAGEYPNFDSALRRNDVWLLGLGARGEVVWERTFGEADVEETRPAIHENQDGTFRVASMRGGVPQLLAVDGSGAAVWHKSYQTSPGVVFGLWVSPDGSGTMVGSTIGRADVWAMGVGPLGDPAWSRRYGRDTSDRGNDVTGFEDGSVVLAATMASDSPEDVDEVWILHPDSDGRAGSQGADQPVTATRLFVAPRDTAVRVRVLPVDVSSASLRVTRTQASVGSVP